MGGFKNIKGGIFQLSKNEIDVYDYNMLNFLAAIVIDSNIGGIKNNIQDLITKNNDESVEIIDETINNIVNEIEENDINILDGKNDLLYNNEYGGFSKDGKEYLICINKDKRLPTVWSHILSNENFGTVITENMGGYSWYKNSRLNRVSTWNNDPVLDIPSEIIYIKDEKTKKSWSLGQNPKPDNNNYNIIYGFGYAKYLHKAMGIEQELKVFVPKKDSCKVEILKLKNTTAEKRKVKIIKFVDITLEEDEINSRGNILVKIDNNNNMMYCENMYKKEDKNIIAYLTTSEKIISYTGNKNDFVGNGKIQNPNALKKISLNNKNGYGEDTCLAFEIEIEIDSFSEKELSIVLGAEDNVIDSKNNAYKYRNIQNCNEELQKVIQYWEDITNVIEVNTPIESVNILLNGWLQYQTIVSRIIARSGYYQSGGAYGFRDQLQDVLCLKYTNPEMVKKQICLHAKHQFVEGDVEHWWHEEEKKGIRTKFSDDLLWLVYTTCEYIECTGNMDILDIEIPYLKGKNLDNKEEEKYDIYVESEAKDTLYEHCKKAIEKSFDFGKNELPKIGGGDWNDGFNKIGNEGKGESVWLGFFLYNILDRFIPICKYKKDCIVERYENIQNKLKRALNNNAWDGRWYIRAFMDDGQPIGTMENSECKIDSLTQSWSVISNAGDNDKKYISMESLENHLIDKENGIIKLLDPPFENGNINPGYIKLYLPGIRENGGQYTHAATWVIMAETLLGFGDKAFEFYKMINPIEHARTKEAIKKYKVEPYVISADIYSAQNLIGRGGWTWYTGSSSWYYKIGIENILGMKIKNNYISFNPCIPKEWKNYKIRFKWKNSIYNIFVENIEGKNTGVKQVYLNEKLVQNSIKLENNGFINIIKVIM